MIARTVEMFQVYAVYPSGNRYPVLKPWSTRGHASDHVKRCRASAAARDSWTYQYRPVQVPAV